MTATDDSRRHHATAVGRRCEKHRAVHHHHAVHLDFLWLVLAGLGGGLAGSVAGLASLVSYPVLLAVGLPPLTANVTNTVSLVFSSAGSVSSSGPELAGQGPRARQLALSAIAGGITGGILLLVTSQRAFALVVPWFIGLASVGVLVPRDRWRIGPHASHHRSWTLSVGVFLIAIYGGYFGAAAGVLMLTLLLLATDDSLQRTNAIKNVLLGAANAVAAVAFIAFGPVRWADVIPLSFGFLFGGGLGPIVVRHSPAGPIRAVIALGGIGLAIHLGLDAYR